MNLKLTRWVVPVLLAVMATFMLITPVWAIEPPTSLEVSGVWVYRNCREDGDQMYLVYYSINYTTNPDEDVSEAYLVRLMNGSDELAAVAPFAYHDDGYGNGVAAIYFTAGSAPTWEGNYTMRLVGNPILSWNGTTPSAQLSTFDLWQDNQIGVTRTVLSSRIIALATNLETAWGLDMVTADDEGQDVLTAFGLEYFVTVVPYLSEVAPYVYAADEGRGGTYVVPEVPEEWERTDYADSLVENIIDTPFDMTAMATAFGVSRGAMTAILYYGCVVAAIILFVRQIGSYKPIMMFSIPLVILGAFLGVPLIVTVLAGLMALAMTAFTIFYKPSNA